MCLMFKNAITRLALDGRWVTNSEQRCGFGFHNVHNMPLELHHHFEGMIYVAQ